MTTTLSYYTKIESDERLKKKIIYKRKTFDVPFN